MKMTIGKKPTDQTVVVGGAKQTTDATAPATPASDGARNELVAKRGIRSKIYRSGDGRSTAEFHAKPVHYLDSDGSYREVDLLPSDRGDVFEIAKNTFVSRFRKRPNGGKIFEAEKNMCKVGLTACGMADGGAVTVKSRKSRKTRDCTCDGAGTCEACTLSASVIEGGAELEYTVDSERIKENIIVKTRAEKYEYDFALSLDNLAVGVSADGKSLELTKKDSGRVQFVIPSPVMFDANGVRSDSVYYEVSETAPNELRLKVVADSAWINAEDRAFPVTVDPAIVVVQEPEGLYYYDEGYEDGPYRYETLSTATEGSLGDELLVYVVENSAENYLYSALTIFKNKLSENSGLIYDADHVRKVTLKVDVVRHEGYFFFCGLLDGSSFPSTIDDEGHMEIDITSAFLNGENEVKVYFMPQPYRDVYFQTDVLLSPPSLEIEYKNLVTQLKVVTPPQQTSYVAGEKFESAGMEVHAVYDNGEEEAVDLDSLEFISIATGHCADPKLTTEDKFITIKYGDFTYNYGGIKICNEGFNDRQPSVGFENVYKLVYVDHATGDPITQNGEGQETYVRLELCDVIENENLVGTPLTAYNLNNIIVKAENIRGIIDERNLPEHLKSNAVTPEEGGQE